MEADNFLNKNSSGKHFIEQIEELLISHGVTLTKRRSLIKFIKIFTVNLMKDCGVE